MTDNRDPTDIDGNETVEQTKTKTAQVAARNVGEDVKWIMANRRGRRIVWGMLSDAGVFQLSFNTNAMLMSFSEGRRSEGLKMLAQVQVHCPDLYTVMTQENMK